MKKRIDLPQVSDVTLPEVFHLRPGVWILILLAILLIVVIFVCAFLPGIIKGGRYVTFKSPLSESGVILDGTYLGSADHQYFIKSGDHTVTLTKGGVEYATTVVTIDHPVFLTWLFHRTRDITIPVDPLTKAQTEAIIRFDLEEIQMASAILEWTMVTRYAPLYANLAQDLEALGIDAQTRDDAIKFSLYYITTQEMLDDAMGAFGGHRGEKIQAMLTMAQAVINGNASPSPSAAKSPLSATTRQSSLTTDLFSVEGTAYPALTITMGRETERSYPALKEMEVTVTTPPFVLANLPVTLTMWAHFIDENPQWAKSNKEALRQQGLVDSSYLAGLAPSTIFVTSRPVTNISYWAGEAFCAWLSQKSGKEVFLPTEAMFSVAAETHPNLVHHGSLTPSPSSTPPSMLLGGVWEITHTPFIPLARLFDYDEAQDLHTAFALTPSPIVKGGSYLSDSASITAESVGAVPPEACGDQIGVRIAWYE
ncbi:MAG TPA: SUMF1/EgtB/PvdO family nonheme iron enzyme [Sphaerochaeta sp.]|nr:SUMF1/EgtB/PvdO family nonheme iron enzyme [Sphaerochaeta sp.]